MKSKKLLALMFVAILLIMSFCGCGKDSASDTESAVPVVEINFSEGFSIVRRADDSVAAGYGTKVFKAIKDSTGNRVGNGDDTAEVNAAGEIIIGNTSRPQSQKALDMLLEKGTGRAAEYIICYIDGAVVIQSVTEDALVNAVDYFVENYCKTCVIMSDLCFVQVDNGNYTDITVGTANIGKYKIVVPQYNFSYYVMRQVEELQEYIYTTTGYLLPIIRDNVAAASDYEIVIDNCNRDGVKTFSENEAYSIDFSGNTVYINGGRNYSTAYAVQLLLEDLKNDSNVATASVSGEFDGKTSVYGNEYRLVWTDEFDTLDTSFWKTKNEVQPFYGNWYGMGTARSTDPKNLRVEDGRLYCTATYDTENFYGMWMDSSKSLLFNQGYMEMSAIIADGDGIWHDFWVYGDLPGQTEYMELDIMECWSGANYYTAVVHSFYIDGSGKRQSTTDEENYVFKDYMVDKWEEFDTSHRYVNMDSLHDEFHSFACEWTENDITYYRDGVEVLYFDFSNHEYKNCFNNPHYFVLSMLVGSNQHNYTEEQGRASVIKNPLLNADYWTNGDSTWTLEYVQLFQKQGQYLEFK